VTFPCEPETPIADGVGQVPHLVPEDLAKRLRSEECLAGGGGCVDPLCLCTCHDADFPPDPSDYHLKRVLSGLDTIISQTPGSYPGFSVPPPYYPDRRAVS
jgi:hypothetical protein